MLVAKSRANFARRLYREAGVTADLQGAPGAKEVQWMQQARAAHRAAQALAAMPAPDAALIGTAAELLAGREPAVVVAALLAASATGVREPFEVSVEREVAVLPPAAAASVMANAAPATSNRAAAAAGPVPQAPGPPAERSPRRAQPEPAPLPAPPPASLPAAAMPTGGLPVATPPRTQRLSAEQRGRAGAAPTWKRPPKASGETQFVPFRINWGDRDGADPRRILAHVCRRGGIDGKLIGAIDVHNTMTTLGVAAESSLTSSGGRCGPIAASRTC